MTSRSKIVFAAILFVLLIGNAYGQATPTSPFPGGVATATQGVSINGSSGGVAIVLTVLDESMNRLDRPAVVKLTDTNVNHTDWQRTGKGGQVTFDEQQVGKYNVEVSAIGYLTARKEIDVTQLRQRQQVKVDVVLHADPDAVKLDPDSSVSGKAAKEAEKAVSDMTVGNFQDAQKHAQAAYKTAPDSAYTNFLMGYMAFQTNDFNNAQTYLSKAVSLDAHDLQALSMLARLQLARKDFAGAKATAEQAVAAAPDSGTAHGLLADAYLNQGDYKNALDQADQSIAKNKSAISNSQVVRGEALAHLGRDQEALQTLKTYMQNAPDSAAGPYVQALIAALEQRQPSTPAATTTAPAKPQ